MSKEARVNFGAAKAQTGDGAFHQSFRGGLSARKGNVQRIADIVALGRTVSPVAAASVILTAGGGIWWLLALRLSAPDQAGRYVAGSGLATLISDVADLGVGYVFIRYFAAIGGSGPALCRTGFALVTGMAVLLVTLAAGAEHLLPSHISLSGDGLTFLMLLILVADTGPRYCLVCRDRRLHHQVGSVLRRQGADRRRTPMWSGR
jgi:hypothetical protein